MQLTYLKQSNSGGNIKEGEIKAALDVMGLKKTNHEIRDIIVKWKSQNKMSGDGALSKEQFKEV